MSQNVSLDKIPKNINKSYKTPGGGGGVLRFGSDGGVPPEAAKPVPIFKGHFGGKGYPLLWVFIQENDVFVYFSDGNGRKYLVSTVKIIKTTPHV